MTQKFHTCINITGFLRASKRKSLKGLFTNDEGKELSDREARNYLNECLAKGWKYIPTGDCDNFDHQTGCQGHLVTQTQ